MVSEAQIKEVAEAIGRNFTPDKVILFGSYAWGTPGPDSDVDLFVIKDVADTRKESVAISGSIFPRPFPLDVLVYRPSAVRERYQDGHSFIKDVLDNGRVLYERV